MKTNFVRYPLPFITAILLYSGVATCQQVNMQSQLLPPHPPAKFEQRYYNIDAKRNESNMFSDDALPRSREFLRIDSTYYVGWLFEGVYKYNHAADYLGYKNAATPLEHALWDIEHDYRAALATRTDEILKFIPVYRIQFDYSQITYYLMTCYANTDQPEKVYALLRHVIKWNFQIQNEMDAWNYLAWTVHRCRIYTHEKYNFLKNSIEENEKLANSYLDTSLMVSIKNSYLNEKIQPNGSILKNEKMSVYHYKNILHSYLFNIDSATHYFELMRADGRLPHNNYANYMDVCGNFREAEYQYGIAAEQDDGDKRLQEWAYYWSILYDSKAQPESGVELAKDMVRKAGPTPGYGWYNIAVARCLTYAGQVSEAKKYTDRAAGFKELHIGTTLGQSQYDLSVQLVKLINKEQEWNMQKFEHSNWWYNPSVLYKMGELSGDRYLQQFLIINQFAQNPERDRVIYKLFSTESTVSWDEIWYLIHDFTTNFFLERFKKEAETDPRKNIRKYFLLYVAKLTMQKGNYREAKQILDNILEKQDIDPVYERLYTARICEAEAECTKELNLKENDEWLYKFYITYPQLVPFSGKKINLNLTTTGDVDNAVMGRLKNCNIEFTNGNYYAADAYVVFNKNGNKKEITYYVVDKKGNYIVPKQTFSWLRADEAGVRLAYKLFNIHEPEDAELGKNTTKNRP